MTRFPRLFLFALALLAVGLACIPVEAAGQPGGGRAGGRFGGIFGMGGFGGGLNLVMVASNEQVQDKLGLNDAQKEAVAEVAKQSRELMRGGGDRPGPDATAEDRAAFREKRQKAQAEIEAKVKAAVGDKAAQLVLIAAGLALQPGPSALANAETAKAVGLSEDTQKKVAEAVQASNKEMMAELGKLREGGAERGAITEKLAELQKATNTKIAGLLTAEDKAKVEAARKAAEGIKIAGPGDRRGRRGGRGGGEGAPPPPQE